MNAFLTDLRTRFGDLEKREQQALLALAAFLIPVVFYLAVWSPAVSFQADSELEFNRHQKLLTYLQSTEAQAKASVGKGSGSQLSGQSLLTSVSRAAQNVGIKPSRLQPEGSDAVSVWFDAVGFSSLMLWLERLEAGQGIVVRQISIDKKDLPGQVSARIVLRN